MPNIALIEDLKEDYKISYCGTAGIEKGICQKFGVRFFEYEAIKFVRGKIFCNFAIPFKLFKSVRKVKKFLQAEKPDLVFCKGGYVCVPTAIAAKQLKIPIITHESDISAGLANKFIAKFCNKVLCAFLQTAKSFKNGVCVGAPMRKNLFTKSRAAALNFFGLKNRQTVLVFGGGSGSKTINDSLIKALPTLCKSLNVLHICGKGNFVDLKIEGYKQVEFVDDMGLAYACADIVVARCGANSACEITALKIPALFIPLENKRTRGDQVKNAEYFYSLGTCRVLRENNLNENTLTQNIMLALNDGEIKNALAKINYECANDKIKNEINKILYAD